ncbi:hypothetical protein AGLY_011785 [Aphis glycines]|uniref:Uncharacterized protein n=1 Tax=Aphis glycines TaxID=307491 RepID=A0A6G0TB69_APHGL|nr:hypothetical protein AGLY_011785 [Aphis glycines]
MEYSDNLCLTNNHQIKHLPKNDSNWCSIDVNGGQLICHRAKKSDCGVNISRNLLLSTDKHILFVDDDKKFKTILLDIRYNMKFQILTASIIKEKRNPLYWHFKNTIEHIMYLLYDDNSYIFGLVLNFCNSIFHNSNKYVQFLSQIVQIPLFDYKYLTRLNQLFPYNVCNMTTYVNRNSVECSVIKHNFHFVSFVVLPWLYKQNKSKKFTAPHCGELTEDNFKQFTRQFKSNILNETLLCI